MIFPGDIYQNYKKNFQEWTVAVFLVLINILIFIWISTSDVFFQTTLKDLISLKEVSQIRVLNEMYLQTLDPSELKGKSEKSFLRDRSFWVRSQNFPFRGDQLEIENGKKSLKKLKSYYENSAQYKFGLSVEATTPWVWLTYQFVHAGLMHLFMNLFFLYFVSQILSKYVSAGWIIGVYIFSGIGAGIGFLFLESGLQTAMVGASGSLCGLIAFLSVLRNTQNIEWSYFTYLGKKGYGRLSMPAFLLFPIYLMSDFTALLESSDGVQNSIAHSAHIGGALTGVIMGCLYLFEKQLREYLLTRWGTSMTQAEVSKLREFDNIAS